jgi:hypothetical protein
MSFLNTTAPDLATQLLERVLPFLDGGIVQ